MMKLTWVCDLFAFFTFFSGGGSGGGGSNTTTSTNYTSNLPEYAKPFYQQALTSAGKETYTTDSAGNVTGVKPFAPYTGDRVAGFTPEQLAVQNEVKNLSTPGDFAQARYGMETGQGTGFDAAHYGLGNALRTFDDNALMQYGSPFQQGVTDIALRQARQEAERQKNEMTLGSLGRGTFGGARQALIQAQHDASTQQNLADIQAKGAQAAYENAQKQFNIESSLGKDVGLGGLSAGLDASKALGALGATEQTANLERLKAQASSAEEAQALQQQIDDVKYQQFREQQDWSKKQIEWFNSMLHGQQGLASTQINYAPAPSMASQIGGLGLAGLGLYNVMNKGG